ncbi:hypothetical protein [Draconibacterium sediminis]|uniref:hypothetical protein n=1 Tax=Draconibacterium sediminis TaxID=1544798 RepID=UPI0026EBF85F|nr:hypothetical protein [Draconibacterium sediminis]
MKHLITTLLILLSFSLFGQEGGADQIMVKTNYLQIDSLKEIAPSIVKVLIVDDNSAVGYTTNFPGGESLWNNNGGYITYLGGNVAVGDSLNNKNLHVFGNIYSHEVRVRLDIPAPDYVFEDDYRLMSLSELQNYLEKNKHLPEIPSAKEMEKEGVDLSEMNMLLLKKVEELTLYVLEQQKQIEALKREISEKF